MLLPEPSTQFKKDMKRFKHKQDVIDELHEVIQILCHKKNFRKNTKIIPYTIYHK